MMVYTEQMSRVHKLDAQIATDKCKWKVLVIITKGEKASGTLSEVEKKKYTNRKKETFPLILAEP